MGKIVAPASAPHPFQPHLFAAIKHGDASDARSLQKHMGPSGLGTTCLRELAHSIAQTPVVNLDSDPWFAVIGKAVHLWLKDALNKYQFDVLGLPRDQPRWLTESRVQVQHEAYSLSGETDVYDTERHEVIDYKILGWSSLKHYRDWGPSTTYRVQAHTYGKGWKQAGYPVRSVCIAMLPRSHYLRHSNFWSEPFNESIADQALERAGLVRSLLAAGAQPWQMPAHVEREVYCAWCPFYDKGVENNPSSCPGMHP